MIYWNKDYRGNFVKSGVNKRRNIKSGYSNNPDYVGDWFGKGQIDFSKIINPEDDGNVWMVKLWSGSGYGLDVYLCKANGVYEAIDKVFEWSYENEGANANVFDYDYVYKEAESFYESDPLMFNRELPKEDYIDEYIDTTYQSNENYNKFALNENFFVNEVPAEYLTNSRKAIKSEKMPYIDDKDIDKFEERLNKGEEVKMKGWTFRKDDTGRISVIDPDGNLLDKDFKSVASFIDWFRYWKKDSLKSSRKAIKSSKFYVEYYDGADSGYVSYDNDSTIDFDNAMTFNSKDEADEWVDEHKDEWKSELKVQEITNSRKPIKSSVKSALSRDEILEQIEFYEQQIEDTENLLNGEYNDVGRNKRKLLERRLKDFKDGLTRLNELLDEKSIKSAKKPWEGKKWDIYRPGVDEPYVTEDFDEMMRFLQDGFKVKLHKEESVESSRKAIKSELDLQEVIKSLKDKPDLLPTVMEYRVLVPTGEKYGLKREDFGMWTGKEWLDFIEKNNITSSKQSHVADINYYKQLVKSVLSNRMTEDEALNKIAVRNSCNKKYAESILNNWMDKYKEQLIKSDAEIADIMKEFDVDGDLNSWAEDYMPGSGKANTKGGELVRAAQRILTEYYDNGNMIGRGLGNETVNPAARYIVEKTNFDGNGEIEDMLNHIVRMDDGQYNSWCKRFESDFANYLRSNAELFDEPNDDDIADYVDENDKEFFIKKFYVEDDFGNKYVFIDKEENFVCDEVDFAEPPAYNEGDIIKDGDEFSSEIDKSEEYGTFEKDGFTYDWEADSAEDENGNYDEWKIVRVTISDQLFEKEDVLDFEDIEKYKAFDMNGNELTEEELLSV